MTWCVLSLYLISGLMEELATLLPFPREVTSQMDTKTVLRLAICYLRYKGGGGGGLLGWVIKRERKRDVLFSVLIRIRYSEPNCIWGERGIACPRNGNLHLKYGNHMCVSYYPAAMYTPYLYMTLYYMYCPAIATSTYQWHVHNYLEYIDVCIVCMYISCATLMLKSQHGFNPWGADPSFMRRFVCVSCVEYEWEDSSCIALL